MENEKQLDLLREIIVNQQKQLAIQDEVLKMQRVQFEKAEKISSEALSISETAVRIQKGALKFLFLMAIVLFITFCLDYNGVI